MMVSNTLGGGACGHLRLALATAQYSSILGTVLYVRPTHPGPLNLTLGLTQFQISQARDQHQEALRLFREVTAVELALKQQIVGAIYAKYLKAARSSITLQINCSIPDIFTHLYDTYGGVTPQALQTLQDNVKAMHFNPIELVNTIFTEIGNSADIAELTKDPFTERQKSLLNTSYCNELTFFFKSSQVE
eukprot:8631774-Ditylum_brightwellii.AAC.1